MQYTISNLNAFIILVTIGFSIFYYVNDNKDDKEFNKLLDKNLSPIQLISQLKGYFFVNPILALSLTITIFSFVGIPPLIGFFAKQMVLSAALDNGYIFLVLIAILTSVISAVYYLGIVKQIFFDKSDYKMNIMLMYCRYFGNISYKNTHVEHVIYKIEHIFLSSSLTITISILTLIILLFIFIPQE
jgi:NADH-ubiquinone oxidoreductase chain 2